MDVYIYALVDPDTKDNFYIGKTVDVTRRYYTHIRDARLGKDKSKKYQYIRRLFDKGKNPEIIIVKTIPEEEWPEWEVWFIEYYKSIGCNLLNDAPGGGAYPTWTGRKHTEETKRKMSIAQKGIKKPNLEGPRGPHKNPCLLPRWDKGLIGRNGKGVYQYSLDGKYMAFYSSTNLAGISTGVSQSDVVRCCNHKLYRAGKFIFSYELHEEGIAPFVYIHSIPIVALHKDGSFFREYPSSKAAARELKINGGSISVVLNHGKQKTAGGYIFVFKSEYDKMKSGL